MSAARKEKKEKVKKKREVGARLKEIRLRLGMDQVPFARFLHVTQPRISGWESGVNPSNEMWLRIAARLVEHGFPEDAVWCWEQAGLQRSQLRLAAGEILGASAVAGERDSIPVMQWVGDGLKETGAPLEVSRGRIERPASTLAIEIPKRLMLVDTSAKDFPSLMLRTVVVYSTVIDPRLFGGRPLLIGLLDIELAGVETANLWYAIVNTGTHTVRVGAWEEKKPKIITKPSELRRLRPALSQLVSPSMVSMLPPGRDVDKRLLTQFRRYGEVTYKTLKRAIGNLKLFRGFQIVGVVVGQIDRPGPQSKGGRE